MPDNTPLNGVAPALGNPPQFTPAYWNTVPRQTIDVVVHRVKDIPESGEKEFLVKVAANGQQMRFRQKTAKITQLVMPGTPVHLELIGNELVTGMYLPDVSAWAFRMTSQDLADYTKEISGVLHAQRLKARQLMLETVAGALLIGLYETGLANDEATGQLTEEYMGMARHLALVAIGALESGPKQEAQ